MRERRRMLAFGKLLDVEHAKRAGAERALQEAQIGEEVARREQERAAAEVRAAEAEWQILVETPGFSPDQSGGLAEQLVACDVRESEAASRCRIADNLLAARQQEWQGLEAQVRSGEGSFRRIRRKVLRREEEARLARIADR